MKHLKKFNESLSNFLPKEELDKMTRDEIENYRYSIIKSTPYNVDYKSSEEKRYAEELGIYQHIRFKDDEYKKYDRWKDTDGDGYKVLHGLDNESIWKLSLFTFKRDYGEPKYIIMDIPEVNWNKKEG